MDSTVKPKQADDPHDLLEVAPGVALVAPSNAEDPTDEELSKLLRAAARQRSGAQARGKSDVAAGPSAPAVDTSFRPAAVNKVGTRSGRWAMGRQAIRAVTGFVIALSIVVGAAAWQLYGDAVMQVAATWVPRLGAAPSPRESGLAEQPRPAAVQATEVAAASEQPAESTSQGVVASAMEAPTLQSMARDVATLGQKVEQLQATIEQLRASQDQMSRDLARGSDGKTTEGKASEQSLRPRASPLAPRPAVAPVRKPIAAFRPPQVTAAPVAPPPAAPYYGQRQPEPSPSAQLSDPELSSVPRPPLPLHQ